MVVILINPLDYILSDCCRAYNLLSLRFFVGLLNRLLNMISGLLSVYSLSLALSLLCAVGKKHSFTSWSAFRFGYEEQRLSYDKGGRQSSCMMTQSISFVAFSVVFQQYLL